MGKAHDIIDRQANLSLTDRELFYRLWWFTRIRWAMGAMALLILLASWYVIGVRFRRVGGSATIAPAVNVVLFVFLYNAAFTFLVHVIRAMGKISHRLTIELALGQLLLDMIAVCLLAHFTGGVENYFIVLVLLPLVIATELLPQSLAYATAGGAVALIHALAWGEQRGIISHYHADWSGESVLLYRNPLYVLEMTTALTVMIFATVFVASSISKRLRQREEQLGEAYRALSLADETKSFFMRKAGHELRAPLAAIHSILGAVSHTSETLEENSRHLIRRAQKRLNALMDLVDELRRYSRLKSPESVLHAQPLNLNELVHDTVELFRQRAKDTGVSLTLDIEPLQLVGDEELLREMVTNLVANAVQYTPSGGRINVTLTADPLHGILTVADTGIGINPAAQEKLFEEFYRSVEARQMLPEGTGLGLVITRRIVEMHGGRIEFTSSENDGTVFTVYLSRQPGAVTVQPS